VDAANLSPTDFASLVTALTSAFGDPTRREIYLFARDASPSESTSASEPSDPDRGVTAATVATRFDLHPNVARHHLDKLAAGGYLRVEVQRSGSGAGRPSKHYLATGKAVKVDLPVRHDDVLVMLLGRVLEELPVARAEQLAEEVGAEYGRLMARSMGDVTDSQRTLRSTLHAVADALTAHGFAAHAEKRNSEMAIVAEHCPFGEAVATNPVICAVDRGMVKGLVSELLGTATTETSVDLQSSRAKGDDTCVTAVGL
jgi:predicted ArsR family transcriptional regulator